MRSRGVRAVRATFLFAGLLLRFAVMRRVLGILLTVALTAPMAWGQQEEMERLASKISEEIRDNLLAVQTKVAYVGMDGGRAYLVGDLTAVRTGQNVVFFRDGSPILSPDSPPRILGRESVEAGRGKVTALHDRTAWVQMDESAKPAVERGDWAVVELDIPKIRVSPFYVDDGSGAAKQDGRSRILRSLVLYHLKRNGLKTSDAPLTPNEVDPSGLPYPATLSQFDTEGVLLIGRILPKPGAPGQIIVGIALFDLGFRDMRFARSYEARTLAAFAPPSKDAAYTALPSGTPPQVRPVSATISAPSGPVDPLRGVLRLFLSTTARAERPAKTPADAVLEELLSVTLPQIALDWNEEVPGKVRVTLPPYLSTDMGGSSVRAREVVDLMTARSEDPSAQALLGTCRWSVLSDTEIGLSLDSPVLDVRERLSDPVFRLINDRYDPVGTGLSPYRLASKGVRTVILEKRPYFFMKDVWSKAPDTLILTVERDPKKRSKGFEEGQADLHEIPDEEYLKFGPASGVRTVQSSAEELVALAFNARRRPMSDVHFRRMVALILDRRTVLEVSLNQRGSPAEGFLPASAREVAQPLVKLPEKSVVAAQVLAKDRGDTGRLVLIFPVEEPHYGLIAEGIRSDLSSLYLTAEPTGLSWRAYSDRLAEGDYDLAVVTLTPGPPYRLWMQQQFASSGKNNRWGYRNSIVDALTSEGGDLGAAQDLLHSELPVIPLCWLTRRFALGPRVAEFTPSIVPGKFFSSIRLK